MSSISDNECDDSTKPFNAHKSQAPVNRYWLLVLLVPVLLAVLLMLYVTCTTNEDHLGSVWCSVVHRAAVWLSLGLISSNAGAADY